MNAPHTQHIANAAAMAVSGADQRSLDWHIDRCGKITASRFKDAIAMTEEFVYRSGDRKGQVKKAEPKESRMTYMRELAFERLTKTPIHSISGKALEWGEDTEDHAQEAYEAMTGLMVRKSPFLLHPKYNFIGCSPDGLVDDDPEGLGGTESKCPFSEHVHIRTWLSRDIPEEHIPQVQGAMMVTGREWWDFISFDPRQVKGLRLFVKRIYRDDCYIERTLLPGLMQFEYELGRMVEELQRMADGLPPKGVAAVARLV